MQGIDGSASRQLGRYELIAEIASGGMGTVLLARLAGAGGFQRLFAVKLLHRQYASDHEFIQMLLDEARIAARIHHPNVVSIQEVEEAPGHGYYLVMDYVEGFPLWDLGHVIRPLPPQTKWRLVHRVALDALNGLDAAHVLTDDDGNPLNVVHRDISPQNILVSVNGIARVTDFGIAKAAARMTTTRVGQVKGKLAYMSPEQARGKPIDLRTDLWAMGVVVWEALCGRRLFKVENETETYNRILNQPIPKMKDVVPGAPPAIEAVLSRALERDVSKRFSSAHEMAVALEKAARGSNLLADAHELGEWIRNSFANELAVRRAAIKQAANTAGIGPGQRASALPGGIVVPALPEHSVSLTVPPPAESAAAAIKPSASDFEDMMDTVVVPGGGMSAPDPEDMSTFKSNSVESSPAVQRALEHARAVMAQPASGGVRRPSGTMPAASGVKKVPTANPSAPPAAPPRHTTRSNPGQPAISPPAQHGALPTTNATAAPGNPMAAHGQPTQASAPLHPHASATVPYGGVPGPPMHPMPPMQGAPPMQPMQPMPGMQPMQPMPGMPPAQTLQGMPPMPGMMMGGQYAAPGMPTLQLPPARGPAPVAIASVTPGPAIGDAVPASPRRSRGGVWTGIGAFVLFAAAGAFAFQRGYFARTRRATVRVIVPQPRTSAPLVAGGSPTTTAAAAVAGGSPDPIRPMQAPDAAAQASDSGAPSASGEAHAAEPEGAASPETDSTAAASPPDTHHHHSHATSNGMSNVPPF